MKYITPVLILFPLCFTAKAQTSITAVTTSNAASTSYSYTNGLNTYNWGVSPNNTTVSLTGFTSGGLGYTYASFLTGHVKLRRVDNATTTGIFSLVWAEAVIGTNIFGMLPTYQNDMEAFFNNRTYNKGTDNFFDNTSSNSNNIERLDWILSGAYSTTTPSKLGFAVFERGAAGAHDPFCIAAITSLDGSGNPLTYGNIVRVASTDYGDPGPNVTYEIVKAAYPGDLLDAGTNTQSRGGVLISFQNLGIAANQSIYGYSLFSNDLPVGATAANLVDYTNATYFPTTTGNPGGIDLVAITGISIENSVLPIRFISFNAVENNDKINLSWKVENEISVDHYEIERSMDGISFFKVNETKSVGNTSTNVYSVIDNVAVVSSGKLFYRIKQYDKDGSYYFSKTVAISRHNKNSPVLIYPNPGSENLYINIANTANDKTKISVFNATGARVILQREQLINGNNSITLDGFGKLSKGVYLLSIEFESGKIITKQFTKQ